MYNKLYNNTVKLSIICVLQHSLIIALILDSESSEDFVGFTICVFYFLSPATRF